MKFGLHDYVDLRDEPLTRTYDDRMALIRAAEAAGFHNYTVTEHHATPLSSTPSPTVYLAAVARETTRIRLGALLFLLPLYDPLRLIQEFCMLDNLSGGRLDIGVGRGISPHEFDAFGADFEANRAMFDDAFQVLLKGLTRDRLTHDGPFYQYDNVPMVLRPVQKPAPPLWYGVRGEESHEFAAEYGMNAVTLGPTEKVAAAVGRYKIAWQAHMDDPHRATSPVTDPIVGAVRAVFVAATDAEAEAIVQPAYRRWYDSLCWLWREHGTMPPIAIPEDYQDAVAEGTLVAGGPSKVADALAAQVETCGFNYLALQLAFGSLTHAQEMRSLELLATHVLPGLERVAA